MRSDPLYNMPNFGASIDQALSVKHKRNGWAVEWDVGKVQLIWMR